MLATTARDLKAVALKLILDIMVSLRLCLRLTILADSLGPDLARQNVDLSYNKVGVHTSTDVW